MTHPKLHLRYYGHPDLRKRAHLVEKITPDIVKLCEEMVAFMLSFDNAIGFAGPQVGIPLRIFVIREEKSRSEGQYYFCEPEVIINPVITSPSKEQEVMEEGCMSLPYLHVKVARPKMIHICYQNVKGEIIEEDASGFRARMLMHENDHLNGVLTIDRADPKERKALEPALRAMKQKYTPSH